MRLRLDADVAVGIEPDDRGTVPPQYPHPLSRIWFDARRWDGATRAQKLALIQEIRKQEAALPPEPDVSFACTPDDIDTRRLTLVQTFDKAEREIAGWLVVRLYQVRGRPWTDPFTLPEFAALIEADEPTRSRLSNPFFRPDFQSLVRDGLLIEAEPGNPAAGARVAPEFVRRCWAGPCGERAKPRAPQAPTTKENA